MFKKTLIAAAALAAFAFAVPQAQAGYGGHGHGHGYGHGHGHYGHHWNYSYGGCWVSRPVTIRVWSDYAYGYIYKTIYRRINVCY
jgi:hypothetical protein